MPKSRKGVAGMKVSVSCSACNKVAKLDVAHIIRTLLDCVERKSVYGGYLCEDCADALEE